MKRHKRSFLFLLLTVFIPFLIIGCNDETLSPPSVHPPLHECGTALTVSGFVPGAAIDIYADNTRIGGGTSDSPWGQRFRVNPPLAAGQAITATQTADGETSNPSASITVIAHEKVYLETLPTPELKEPIYDCGGALSVRNLADGGLLEVFADDVLVGSANGCGRSQWLSINPVFEKDQKIYATEKLCADVSPKSDYKIVIETPDSITTPAIREVYEGGKFATVDFVENGAMVEVHNGADRIAGHHSPGGSQIMRLHPQPAAGDTLIARQYLCNTKSDPSDPVDVYPCSELPTPFLHDICIGDRTVSVSGTVLDARVQVFRNGHIIGDGGSSTINLVSSITADSSITAKQILGTCESPLSDPVHVNKYECDIPPYSPGYWNNNRTIREENNCYNYANNKRTDTYAQPGDISGYNKADLSCGEVSRAAESDGIRPVPPTGVCPCNEAKLALVVDTESDYSYKHDYHWYRRDSDGKWSHKPGGTRATNLDKSNNIITNPETANRGRYKTFCGYFCSCSDEQQGQGHENII